MKKIFAVLVLVLLLLCGCSPNRGKEGDKEEGEVEVEDNFPIGTWRSEGYNYYWELGENGKGSFHANDTESYVLDWYLGSDGKLTYQFTTGIGSKQQTWHYIYELVEQEGEKVFKNTVGDNEIWKRDQ